MTAPFALGARDVLWAILAFVINNFRGLSAVRRPVPPTARGAAAPPVDHAGRRPASAFPSCVLLFLGRSPCVGDCSP